MTNKRKPNFKKKEPNSRKNNGEEFAEDIDNNQAKQKNAQQNNQQKR